MCINTLGNEVQQALKCEDKVNWVDAMHSVIINALYRKMNIEMLMWT